MLVQPKGMGSPTGCPPGGSAWEVRPALLDGGPEPWWGAAEAISHASGGSVTALPAPCPLDGRSHMLLWEQNVSGRQVGSPRSRLQLCELTLRPLTAVGAHPGSCLGGCDSRGRGWPLPGTRERLAGEGADGDCCGIRRCGKSSGCGKSASELTPRPHSVVLYKRFPGGTSGEAACQCRRGETWAHPWVGKIPCSSVLGWRIPWTEEPEGYSPWGHSQTRLKLLSTHALYKNVLRVEMWRRQWHPTPVLLPGKSHGWRAWWAAVHGVAKSRTRLSDFTFTFLLKN